MTTYGAAFLAARVLALYLTIIGTIEFLSFQIQGLPSLLPLSQQWLASGSVLKALGGVLLWVNSERFATSTDVTLLRRGVDEEEIVSEDNRVRVALLVGVSLLGIWLLASGASQLLYEIARAAMQDPVDEFGFPGTPLSWKVAGIVSGGVRFIAGLIIVFGRVKIATRIAPKPAVPTEAEPLA